MNRTDRLYALLRDRPLLVEIFIAFNLGFLILDVLLAHAVNNFMHWAEWIPVAFSAVGTVLLVVGLVRAGWGRRLGEVVGWGALAVGLAGLLWHLESHFFAEATLHSLVYSAPFAAPLAYAGLGFLLLLNRRVPVEHVAWGRWVLFFAWAGFVGNFALSLADHAQNGFFFSEEWISVIVSALGVGFLLLPIVADVDARYLWICFGVLGLQVLAGLLGLYFHLAANLPVGEAGLRDSFVFGAPVFAPLLFADLALLAALGVWDLLEKVRHPAAPAAG